LVGLGADRPRRSGAQDLVGDLGLRQRVRRATSVPRWTIQTVSQKPVLTWRTPPSTEPFSRGVAGVQAVAWKA
jgi:hypothetical protein